MEIFETAKHLRAYFGNFMRVKSLPAAYSLLIMDIFETAKRLRAANIRIWLTAQGCPDMPGVCVKKNL